MIEYKTNSNHLGKQQYLKQKVLRTTLYFSVKIRTYQYNKISKKLRYVGISVGNGDKDYKDNISIIPIDYVFQIIKELQIHHLIAIRHQ